MSDNQKTAVELELADNAIESAENLGKIIEQSRIDRMKESIIETINQSIDAKIEEAISTILDGFRTAILDLRMKHKHHTDILNAVFKDSGISFDIPIYYVEQIEAFNEDLAENIIVARFEKGEDDTVQLKTFAMKDGEKEYLDLTKNPFLYQTFTNELKNDIKERFEFNTDYYFMISTAVEASKEEAVEDTVDDEETTE